jgi:hypothetical protein
MDLPNKLAYSVPALAESADISRSKIYEEMEAGRLKAKKFGSRTLILGDEAKRWLDSLPDFQPGAAAQCR